MAMTNHKIKDSIYLIMAGFMVRTRKETAVFECLIGTPLVIALLKPLDEEKKQGHIDMLGNRVKRVADWIITSCRFAGELPEEEKVLTIGVGVDDHNRLQLTPRNFLAAVVARLIEFQEMADQLDNAILTARSAMVPKIAAVIETMPDISSDKLLTLLKELRKEAAAKKEEEE